MKKHITLVLASILILMSFQIKVSAATIFYPDFNNLKVGRVVEVIDGEVLRVIYDDDYSKMEIVKLIGVNTEGNKEAYQYVTNYYLGKSVYILPERLNKQFPVTNGWRNVYILKDANKTLNELLIRNGYAKVDISYSDSESYETLLAAEKSAKITAQGIWNATYESNYFEKGPKVNLNTASSVNLMNVLEDTTYEMAGRIIDYRRENPFNTIEEIKLVHEKFNSKWFEKNKKYLTVITNVAVADDRELTSLFNYSYINQDKLVEAVVNFRVFNEISSFAALKNVDGITDSVLEKIKEFITFDNVADYENPDSISKININTASLGEMKKYLGLTDVYAKSIYDASVFYQYKFRNLKELANTPVYLSDLSARHIEDNANVYTDINSANQTELLSLFGRTNLTSTAKEAYVNKIMKNRPYNNSIELTNNIGSITNYFKDCVYFTERTNKVLNLNAIDKETIVEMFHLTGSDKYSVLNQKTAYKHISELPFKIENYDSSNIMIYTNINSATKAEIMQLSKLMSSSMADTIIYYRNQEPFAAIEDLYDLLSEFKYGATVISQIKDYVSYR